MNQRFCERDSTREGDFFKGVKIVLNTYIHTHEHTFERIASNLTTASRKRERIAEREREKMRERDCVCVCVFGWVRV